MSDGGSRLWRRGDVVSTGYEGAEREDLFLVLDDEPMHMQEVMARVVHLERGRVHDVLPWVRRIGGWFVLCPANRTSEGRR